MMIYKDYDTTNLLFNEPCYIEGLGSVYPISVKEYKKFQTYVQYIMFSKKHLNLSDEITLLNGLIVMMSGAKCKNPNNLTELNQKIFDTLNEITELFSMLTKKDLMYEIKNNGYIFKDKDGEININDGNFETFRQVVLTMNLLKEPKIFEDKLYEKMYYSAIKANRKPGASLDDIIVTVIQDMKISFKEVSEYNVMQLYALYTRIVHVKNSDAITIYRTCTDKLPKIEYTDGVVDNLFKEQDDSDLFVDLGGIADKLT